MRTSPMIGLALGLSTFVAGAAFADLSYDDAVAACNAAIAEKLSVDVASVNSEVKSWRTRGRYFKMDLRHGDQAVYCEVHVSKGDVKTLDMGA